jgi:putative Mg2+ transporter-C (MgtC) family protein
MDWVFGNLRGLIPDTLFPFVTIFASFICGAVVGTERESQEKPAGLRTLILICLGSTIFTLISASNVLGRAEPSRIAAQIVTGVGFLGAGAILRDRTSVVGITTAATIWAVAAVGIVVGAGYAIPGLMLSVTIVVVLTLVGRVENRISGPCAMHEVTVVYQPDHGKTRPRLQRVLDQRRYALKVGSERTRDDGLQEMQFSYCTLHREHRGVVSDVADVPGVEAIDA